MLEKRKIITKVIIALVVVLGLFFNTLWIGNYGLLYSVVSVLLILPWILISMFPTQKTVDFYGKHLQLITVSLFVALALSWTLLLAGIFGVMLVFEIPMIFIQAPPLLYLIIVDIIVLVSHRVIARKVVRQERFVRCILRTQKMIMRIPFSVVGSFLLLTLFIATLGALRITEPLIYLSWIFAFVFWSYWFQLPMFLGFLAEYAEARMCLSVALEAVETADTRTEPDEELRKALKDLIWLKHGLEKYNRYLSSLPGRPIIVNLNGYYDAAYAAIMAGTKTDKERIFESLKNMLEAMGSNKKENNFHKFIRALFRIKKNRIMTWEVIRTSLRTEPRREKLWHQCKPVLVYIIPMIGTLLPLILQLLGLFHSSVS